MQEQEGCTGLDQKKETEDLLYVEKHGSIADVVPQKYEEEDQKCTVSILQIVSYSFFLLFVYDVKLVGTNKLPNNYSCRSNTHPRISMGLEFILTRREM